MYVFLDTEFIPAEAAEPAWLLSIGLCSEAGHEFYREVEASVEVLSCAKVNGLLIREEVLPQLGRQASCIAEPQSIARDLAAWLDGLGASDIEVCYDFHVDYDLLEELLALVASPTAATLCPTHVGYLNKDEELEAAATACFASLEAERGIRRHHALADAFALRAKFWAAHGQ